VNVVVLGPYGSGKSTLVRRLMKARTWRKIYGTSPLPMYYESPDLIVYGNYETTSRMRHGMTAYDRDPFGFDEIMRRASESPKSGVMEGGFTKWERLWAGYGPEFAKTCRTVYINVDGMPVPRLGKSIGAGTRDEYEYKIMRTVMAMRELGIGIEMVSDRQRAMDCVCELLGVQRPEGPIEEDYR